MKDGFWFYKRNYRDKITVVEVVTINIGLTDIFGEKLFVTKVYEIGFREPMYLDEAKEEGRFLKPVEMPDFLIKE